MNPAPAPQHALDTLWQAPALVWVLVAGECLAIVLALAPGVAGDRWVYFGLASLAIQWIALLTLGLLYLARHRLAGLTMPRLARLALGLLLVSTWVVTALAAWLIHGAWALDPGEWIGIGLRLSGIVLAVGFLGLAAFQNHWRARQLAVRAKQAELQALQARIRPHFLFNTLNTGAALVHQRPEEAERLLLDLADLFRAALAGPRQIPLEDELGLARRYLEIESLRFGDRLRIGWHLPRSLPAVTVPALSIQPLVENAVRHGAERMPAADIEVLVTTTVDAVVVRISNPLPDAGVTGSTGHRVGLNATQVRIEALTGGRGSVHTQVADGRFVATVRLPTGDA